MSGYGGNLTYPTTKVFKNNYGTVTDWMKIYEDKKLQNAVAGNHTLTLIDKGDTIVGTPNAGVAQVLWQASVARVMDVVLSAAAPCDTCDHELGFTVNAIAQHPGVMNDNLYGQRRTYAHKFVNLDPITAGLISDADLTRAYADISQQIADDIGRYNGHMQGNYEAVVDCVETVTGTIVPASDTVDIPALGLYGLLAAPATVIPAPVGGTLADYLTISTTEITNVGAVKSGYGFVLHAAAPLTAHKLTLTTKKEYQDSYTFMVEDLSGTFMITTDGSFELLPWEEVYREFAHMEHMSPLSNHHADEKPADTVIDAVTTNSLIWGKYILDANQNVGNMHGASHGNNYKQSLIIYLRANAADHTTFKGLLDGWKA